MAIGACEHCQTRITYPAIFCAPCVADHRPCSHGFWCEEPGEHRALREDYRKLTSNRAVIMDTPPAPYVVMDEAPVSRAELEQAILHVSRLLAHADTCPCAHCAHARASTSDQHGAGASGPAQGNSLGPAPVSEDNA